MEYLSNIIKSLFCNQEGDHILQQCGTIPFEDKSTISVPRYLASDMKESDVMSLIRKSTTHDTLNQLEIVGQVLISKWMEPEKNCPEMSFKRSSIFNALLHFGLKTMTLKDNEPLCVYKRLFRWHLLTSYVGEDLITTAYCASKDLRTGFNRNFFDWPAFIGHDNKELNRIFYRPMSDLHTHLKGSSFNFDISWLSVMNNVTEMESVFEKIYRNRKEIGWDKGFYNKMYRAACLRLFLASQVGLIEYTFTYSELLFNLNLISMKSSDIIKYGESIKEQFRGDSDITLPKILNKIHHNISNGQNGSLNGLDYITINRYEKDDETLQILSFERMLMYHCFRRIFENNNNNKNDKLFESLLYAYLAYKTEFREKIIQMNDRNGFANFAEYEELKDCFIEEGKYEDFLYKAAIVPFLNSNENRFLEVRIAPKDNEDELSKTIHKICANLSLSVKRRLSLIVHFIKTRDKRDLKTYRHEELRLKVKQQAVALYKFRNNTENWGTNPIASMVVGIDAANSEAYCRPEVFGQAFRFLRAHYIEEDTANCRPNDLNITYHVGEDFYDIADGLRAIEEAMIFLNLNNGDRIGHALALGTEVEAYYRKRSYTICAIKQTILDNLAWLHHKCRRLIGDSPLCYYLESEFHSYFFEVYGKDRKDSDSIAKVSVDADDMIEHLFQLNNIQSYYRSWLLRGNSPLFGKEYEEIPQERIEKEWYEARLNHHRGAERALDDPIALELFDLYNSDRIVNRGSFADTFTIREPYRKDFIDLLKAIQEHILHKIEKKRIAIECNPSSNFRIGEFQRYDEHPIVKFFNYGLNVPYPRHDIIVSINTDDQGIFATSLEREYSLLSLALERNEIQGSNNSPRQVIEWLDKVRQMGNEQQFLTINKQ